MYRSPRASARRHVMRQLDTIRTRVKKLRGWWTAETKVYVEAADRTPTMAPNAYLRDRLPGEYPENQRHYWTGTVAEIDKLVDDLADLRLHCYRQAHETPDTAQETR